MSDDRSPAIEIADLEMVYGDRFGSAGVRALAGISFRVERGEIFGFLGPNGAGKTTTIHSLMNFIFPTAGEARIFGLPVSNPNCRRQVGFLPELFSFDKFLSGRRLLDYMALLSGMDRSQIKQQAQKYLDFFDMAKTQSRKIKTYSKGMMQKIGLIQALLADPDLLILDEPTSGMDPIAKAKVKQLFLDLKDRGKTVFLSTHILSDVQQIADRVAIINKGKLLKIDSVDNLLRKSDDTEILFSLESEKLAHLETGVIIRKRENGLQAATVGGKEARQKLLRQLVEVGADIIAVTPPRTDLEDIFVQLVENGNQSDTSDQSA